MALQIRRGTDAERQTITPKEGELVFATDTNRLFVGGKIAPSQTLEVGGILVSGSLVNDTNPTLAQDLDLNNNNITGTGNISINGNITATGNINLGDGVEDNVIVGGQITGSLIPGSSGLYDLGAPAGKWNNGYVNSIDVATTASIGEILLSGNIANAGDSSLVYNGSTNAINVATLETTGNLTVGGDLTVAGNYVGDFKGSVFGDDSTAIVDAVNNTLTGDLTGNVTGDSTGVHTGNVKGTTDVVIDVTTKSLLGDVRSANGNVVLENGTDGSDATFVGSVTGQMFGNLTGTVNGTLDGDMTGSVFGDDSTPLINGQTGDITNGTLTFTQGVISSSVDLGNVEADFIGTNAKVVQFGDRGSNLGTVFIDGNDVPLVVRGVASGSGSSTMVLQGSRFSGTTKDTLQVNDFIGAVGFDGFNGTEFKRGAFMNATMKSAINSGNFDTDLTVSVLRADGLYSQFTFEADGRFATVANSYTALPDAVLPTLTVPEGSVGYGSDREAIVVFDGTSFKTVPTFIGVPTGPTDSGKAGQVSADANYMYICHSTDNWIRVAKDATWT